MEEKNCENQELEIDLIELCRELKNNIALIIAATVICAAAAGAYLHFMTVPVYSYTRMIKLPENALFHMSDQDKFSFINIDLRIQDNLKVCMIRIEVYTHKNTPKKGFCL